MPQFPPAPESFVDFVLITTREDERDALLQKLPGYLQLSPIQESTQTFYHASLHFTHQDSSTGTYQVIIMLLLGKGRVQAAIAAVDAIQAWKPRNLILVGTAKGVAKNGVEKGDILISSQIVDGELQKITPNGPEIEWNVYHTDPRLLAAAQAFVWSGETRVKRPAGIPRRLIGPIVSGDKEISYAALVERYKEVWAKMIGIEMEASGVAAAVFQSALKPGAFIVRACSGLADRDQTPAESAAWNEYACDVAAAYTVEWLKTGPTIARNVPIPLPPPPPSNIAVRVLSHPADIVLANEKIKSWMTQAKIDLQNFYFQPADEIEAYFRAAAPLFSVVTGDWLEQYKCKVEKALSASRSMASGPNRALLRRRRSIILLLQEDDTIEPASPLSVLRRVTFEEIERDNLLLARLVRRMQVPFLPDMDDVFAQALLEEVIMEHEENMEKYMENEKFKKEYSLIDTSNPNTIAILYLSQMMEDYRCMYRIISVINIEADNANYRSFNYRQKVFIELRKITTQSKKLQDLVSLGLKLDKDSERGQSLRMAITRILWVIPQTIYPEIDRSSEASNEGKATRELRFALDELRNMLGKTIRVLEDIQFALRDVRITQK